MPEGWHMSWRVGSKVPLNVYEGDRPVCQCHTPEDAARIVAAMNNESEIAHASAGHIRRISELEARIDGWVRNGQLRLQG